MPPGVGAGAKSAVPRLRVSHGPGVAAANTSIKWDPLHLLEGVRAVASLAAPQDITSATQRRFDLARVESDRFADLPPARRICERLGLSWYRTLRLAAMPPTERAIQ